MTTRLLIHITLALLWGISSPVAGIEQHSEETLLKAVFIYNFAKFTRWPATTWSTNNSSLRICTIGDDELSRALVQLNDKKVREHTVIIEPREFENSLGGCHVLYIARSMRHMVKRTTNPIHLEPILTVSEIKDFTKHGGMIELYRIQGRIRFKINLRTARDAGLDLSSRLLKLAVEVQR
ncbi:MAG: YfiR family protein [Candidatus Thiodiazotropha sp.]